MQLRRRTQCGCMFTNVCGVARLCCCCCCCLLVLAEAGAVPCAMHLLAQFYPCSRCVSVLSKAERGITA